MFDTAYKIICAALMLALVQGAASGEPMHKKKEKKLLEKSLATYRVLQGDNEVGTESVTREVWSNNTLILRSTSDARMSDVVNVSEETELVAEDESFFPRSYSMKKTMTQAEMQIHQDISVKMFANVAVVETRIQDNTDTRNIVVGTGTPLLEPGVTYLTGQLLFWYDRDRGGRQSFSVLDVTKKEPEDVVLRFVEADTVMSLGVATPVDVFELEWPTHKSRYYIDGKGRIVAVNMGYQRVELVEWKVEVSSDEGDS